MKDPEMRRKPNRVFFFLAFILILDSMFNHAIAEETQDARNRDAKVKIFLEGHKDQWLDWNVPEADGKVLYDLIIRNNYKKAVDIGTSTGHSAIWMAWALSKTGGKLITIEIDKGRYKKAVANFKAAGLSDVIDARLADAHELVKELDGPFDFVFSDADKEWYKNYFIALAPKLEVGGCYTTHNVYMGRGRRGRGGSSSYMDYLLSLPNLETTVDSRGSGLSISYKKSK